ncbi:hypothetical protein [Leucobacter sp. GX0328]
MCGACPGGGRLSAGTLFLAQRFSPARTAQLVSELTGDRLRIAPLGDGWSVGLPTGGMTVAADFETLVRVCASFVRADRRDDVRARAAMAHSAESAGIVYILERFSAAPPSTGHEVFDPCAESIA